ncbi:MAG: ferritin-like domain-containing protein, partial [Paracoccaceae bacterium]
ADLRAFLADDVAEAANHRDALGRILADHGAPAQEHRDQAMARILSEARGWADQIDTPAVRDAALIASAQRIQHYEIAVYGTLAAWAKLLGLDKDLGVLLTMLGEERKADATLTEMAMSGVNQRAAA